MNIYELHVLLLHVLSLITGQTPSLRKPVRIHLFPIRKYVIPETKEPKMSEMYVMRKARYGVLCEWCTDASGMARRELWAQRERSVGVRIWISEANVGEDREDMFDIYQSTMKFFI